MRRVNGGAWQEADIQSREVNTDDNDEPYCIQTPVPSGTCGRIYCAYRDHTYSPPGSNVYGTYRITIAKSDNDGASFDYLSTALTWSRGETKFFGLWSPFLRLFGTRLVAGWSENTDDIDRNIVLWYNDQTGSPGSWKYLNTAIGGNTGYTNDSYPASASIDSSKLMSVAFLLTSNLFGNMERAFGTSRTNVSCRIVADEVPRDEQRSRIQYAISPNNGVSWPASSKVLYQPPADKGAAKPQIINVGGILVSLSNSTLVLCVARED